MCRTMKRGSQKRITESKCIHLSQVTSLTYSWYLINSPLISVQVALLTHVFLCEEYHTADNTVDVVVVNPEDDG